MIDEKSLQERKAASSPHRDERQRRRFGAGEAKVAGQNRIKTVARVTLSAANTMGRGLKDLGRNRRLENGRKSFGERINRFRDELSALFKPGVRGDATSALRRVRDNLRRIAPQKLNRESLATLLHRFRLSPLMAGALIALGVFDLAGLAVLGRGILSVGFAEKEIRTDWRPPTLTQYEALATKPADADVQTLTRPIFSKTRRPYLSKDKKQASPAAPIPAAPPTNLKLLGLAKYKDVQSAFIVSGSTPGGKWCAVGDEIDGWKVTRMQNSEVILQSDDRTVQISLYPEPSDHQTQETQERPQPQGQMQPNAGPPALLHRQSPPPPPPVRPQRNGPH